MSPRPGLCRACGASSPTEPVVHSTRSRTGLSRIRCRPPAGCAGFLAWGHPPATRPREHIVAIFTVDTDAVSAANGQALATAEQLRTTSLTLSGQLAQLETTWTGASATSFQSALAQWKAVQQSVEQALDGLGRALGAASSQYAEAERLTSGMFR
ncbi:WXG100 family type VII secretion target [Microbacterium paludicola]|uniref:WXG100 family type VII secretion target n=1 Tax=Microbacterium paludicola TaxID=300019 RepID=A0A4Y9G0Z9_9MICO|nr:WXG100 family type VII secretion target [Microbacterium paludicola]